MVRVVCSGRLERDQVVQVDRLQRRAHVVKAVGSASKDREIEVELGARRQRDAQLASTGFSLARYATARSW